MLSRDVLLSPFNAPMHESHFCHFVATIMRWRWIADGSAEKPCRWTAWTKMHKSRMFENPRISGCEPGGFSLRSFEEGRGTVRQRSTWRRGEKGHREGFGMPKSAQRLLNNDTRRVENSCVWDGYTVLSPFVFWQLIASMISIPFHFAKNERGRSMAFPSKFTRAVAVDRC